MKFVEIDIKFIHSYS